MTPRHTTNPKLRIRTTTIATSVSRRYKGAGSERFRQKTAIDIDPRERARRDRDSLAEGNGDNIQTKGFSFIEILVPCPTQFGRYVLGMSDPREVVQWYKDNSVTLKKAEKMSSEELEGKFLLGEFAHREDRTGVVERYWDAVKKIQEGRK